LNPQLSQHVSPLAHTITFFFAVGCVMLSLWRSHWKSVFDDVLLLAGVVQTTSHSLTWNLHLEQDFIFYNDVMYFIPFLVVTKNRVIENTNITKKTIFFKKKKSINLFMFIENIIIKRGKRGF
jgi:hypothetical protein